MQRESEANYNLSMRYIEELLTECELTLAHTYRFHDKDDEMEKSKSLIKSTLTWRTGAPFVKKFVTFTWLFMTKGQVSNCGKKWHRCPSPTGTWRDLSAVITVTLLLYCFVIVDVLNMVNNTRPAPFCTCCPLDFNSCDNTIQSLWS